MTALAILDDFRPVTPLRLADPVFDAEARILMWGALDDLARAAVHAPFMLRRLADNLDRIEYPKAAR